MADPRGLIVGVVLTFAGADTSFLNMTVALTEPRPAVLDWQGEIRTSSTAAVLHTFAELPAPTSASVRYVVAAGSSSVAATVEPLGGGPIAVGVVGDGGPGAGPRRLIWTRMDDAGLDVVVTFGDPTGWAGDDARRRARALPVTKHAPIVFVGPTATETKPTLPWPDDPVGGRWALPKHVYHLRLGATVFLMVDAELGFAVDGGQAGFMRAACDPASTKVDTCLVFVAHGPRSSAAVGGHPHGPDLVDLAGQLGVTGIFSGHEPAYERLALGTQTVVVTGNSGGAIGTRRRIWPQTEAFFATPHWLRLDLGGSKMRLRAFALEASVLDDVVLEGMAATRGRRGDAKERSTESTRVAWSRLGAAVALLGASLLAVAAGLLRAGRGPR